MTPVETQNTEKHESPIPITKQNSDDWNVANSSTTKQMLTQEDKINAEKNDWKEDYITIP